METYRDARFTLSFKLSRKSTHPLPHTCVHTQARESMGTRVVSGELRGSPHTPPGLGRERKSSAPSTGLYQGLGGQEGSSYLGGRPCRLGAQVRPGSLDPTPAGSVSPLPSPSMVTVGVRPL